MGAEMWKRLGIGALALAVLANLMAGPQPHVHAANGHRVIADTHHAGDPSRPLFHAHRSSHHHDHESSPDGDHGFEDVVSVEVHLLQPTMTHATVLVAIVQPLSVLDLPAGIRTTSALLQPPAHAPPRGRPSSPRAPPRAPLLTA
jgi:hypothetical protein